MALRLDPENGFWLAFSGGKDSQALFHIAKMAGVKFKAHMNLTSVDPPEVIRFVKEHYPDVELIKPKMSIYFSCKKKGVLPTRTIRWCCAEYKEIGGIGKVTLTGIRKQESSRRSKREEISTEIKGKRNEQSFDQWSEHEEKMVACVGGKDKIPVSPIIYSGYGAQIGSSGYGAKIDSMGENSVIMCAGNNSKAKAKIGSWITLAEWGYVDGRYIPKCVKTEYVDGEHIKEDTWYKLENGEFVFVEQ